MRTIFILTLTALVCFVQAAQGADAAKASYRFDQGNPGLVLSGNASVKDGLLVFSGPGQAVLPDSTQFHITPAGLTMTAVLRFAPKPQGHDLGEDIFSKGHEWLFSRHGNGTLYLSHSGDGKKFHGGIRSGRVIPAGEWAHYVAVFSRIQRQGQGEIGYLQKVYINGEQVGQAQVLDVEPLISDEPVVFGYGLAKDAWAMSGEAAEFTIEKRAWSDDEVEQDAIACGRVKTSSGIKAELTAPFIKALEGLPPHQRAALERAGRAGADQSLLGKAAEKLSHGQKQDAIRLLSTEQLEAMFIVRGGNTVFPLISLYDKRAQREIFGRRTLGWELRLRKNKVNEYLQESAFEARVQEQADGSALLVWECGDGLRVEMPLKLVGARLEAGLKVMNNHSDTILEAVTFPRFSFRKLDSGTDKLVIPFMSGVELDNPTVAASTVARQDFWYPSSDVNMQFHAYYDAKSGIYFAHEDPTGAVKRVTTMGKRGDLDAAYTTSVGQPIDGSGGNSYTLSGVAAVEVFQGNWYEAAQIYRRFVQQKSAWGITELPRQDTPQWLRDNCVSIIMLSRYEYTPDKMLQDAIVFRNYLELPYLIHWSWWDDISKGSWPHFFAKDSALEVIPELKKNNIHCEVYIDTRLWAENDGPDRRSSWMYSPLGEHYAVRTAENNIPFESYTVWFHEPGPGKRGWYSERHRYAVQCPAAAGWQEWILWLCERVAGYGVTGIYHDQVMAASPHLCYNPEHGHALGDAQTWVRNGYYPMLKRMRRKLKLRYPDLTHSSEDFAEPYLREFDHAFCWRWTHEQIPLVDAVYGGGSIQLGNRLYGDTGPKCDIKALYAKLGEQLVCGEQLGYFNLSDIQNPAAALQIKRYAHLRNELLSVFNAGQLLKELEYAAPMPRIATVWNAYKGGSGGGDKPISTPVVQQGRWRRLSDQAVFTLFANTVDSPQRFSPKGVKAGSVLVSSIGITPFSDGSEIALAPFEMALLLNRVPQAEAENLQKTLAKIKTFVEPGVAYDKAEAQKRAGRKLTVQDADRIKGASAADNGAFAGWIAPGASFTFSNVLFGKAVVVDLEAKAGNTVRLLFNERQVGMATLTASGRQQLRIPVSGQPDAVGTYLVHLPQGALLFYSLEIEP